jgi:hypothetical protein
VRVIPARFAENRNSHCYHSLVAPSVAATNRSISWMS